MKKLVLSIATLLSINVMVKAQTTIVNFEQIVLDSSGYQNGYLKGPIDFTTQGIVFKNNYNYAFPSWTDFAFSNNKNTVTPGYINQYSSFAGGGADSSKNFALAYGDTEFNFDSATSLGTQIIGNVRITNNTYAALEMKNGSSYSKKFGGITGNDPDYFYVKFMSTDTTNLDSVIYYLADFRFANNNDDYIVDNWKDVDLTPLNASNGSGVKGIKISFHSSDVDSLYGYINTPTYVCLDNITYYKTTVGNKVIKPTTNSFYPNPASTFIISNAAQTNIYTLDGSIVKSYTDKNINITDLANGYYIVKMLDAESNMSTQKLIKQ
jgi:hypothetical protein